MKKILSDKSFWIILVASIVSLIVLTVGVVFLTRKNEKEFYSAGYIINSSATGTDKYYFEDNTVYKENVFNEYVFKDKDNKEVSTSKDNFIHYLDNSLSFMKNGAIMDLDNFNKNIVPYYNITDKSIIKYNNGGYYIETADKTLVFGNFLGRITDNKYIVVGPNIRVKLAGNDKSVKGEYFEILFVEDGIVKIENQDGSYQTISDGTTIYIGDDIKINLGDKSVIYGKDTKLSLSEITIDGNENIDIIPEGVVDKDDKDDKPNKEEKPDNNAPAGDGDNKPEEDNKEDGTDTPDTEIDGEGDKVEGETTTVIKKEVAVNLIDASSNVNSINVKFQVIDTAKAINGDLTIELVNTTTGKKVKLDEWDSTLVNSPEEQTINIDGLMSNCNYVMTITDKSGVQFFQKSFRTDSLDLKLKRELVTETSLSYSLEFDDKSKIESADIILYDDKGSEVGIQTVYKDTDSNALFEGLTSNTTYRVVVDNVVIDNVRHSGTYRSVTTDMTLKEKPVLGNVNVKTDNDSKSFTLSMDKPVDEQKAIVRYTYEIYKSDDLTEETMTTATPVYSFSRTSLDSEILKLDEAKNLFGNTDYKFKVVVQYYDNYRYNEIETIYSESFNVVGKPTISFEETEIDFNRIAGKVIIDDTDCTIPFEGRECNNAPNNFIIRYYGGSTAVRTIVEGVVVDSENQTLSFDLDGLQENTVYTFEVFADIDLHNEDGIQKGQYIGGFNVTTTGISALMMQNWKRNGYSFENPISVNTEMVSTTPDDDSIDKLASIKINLYSGDVSKTIDYARPIASIVIDEGVKEKFFNKSFAINSSMFEYEDGKVENLEILKELSGGRLNRNYTIEITDAFDESGTNEFSIINNIYVYQTPSILLLEDEVTKPEVVVEEITNIQTKSGDYKENYNISYISGLDDEIIRGYKVTAIFDKATIENFAGYNSINKINFYVKNGNGSLVEKKVIDFSENEEYTVYLFLKEGTDYGTVDNDLRRGNTYTFSYDISIDDDGDPSTDDLLFPTSKPVSDKYTAIKQAPSFRLYIESSTRDSVTYKYNVTDYDNALYMEEEKYYIHYNVSDNEEKYSSEFVKDGSSNLFTIANLVNGSVYTMQYYVASVKDKDPYMANIGNYFFDGYYSSSDYVVNYELEYGNFDNRLKIIIEDNEFLDRISAYLLTMEVNGDKYSKVVSNLDKCADKKCVIIDYKEIASFKGKNINISIDGFYDTGFIGFGQKSLLGNYFKSLGYVDEDKASLVGFVYQTIVNGSKGKYFYVNNSGYSSLFDYPRGILGFELTSSDNMNAIWKLNTVNMIDINNNKFVNYGDIKVPSNKTDVISGLGTINILNEKLNVTPKVLDKISLSGKENTFKFTSITPKVSAKTISADNKNSLINGAIMDIDVSLDLSTLETDFVKTDGKYKFYIDIYEKTVCTEADGDECTSELIPVKTVETDYDSLSNVVVDGLDPATLYYYKVSADMNKGGEKVKTPLFDYNRTGYVEFLASFSTLNDEEVFNKVTYGYTSTTDEETYSHRELTIKSLLKNTTNFDLKLELYAGEASEDNKEFEIVINNEDIDTDKMIASYVHDITGNDFVFGPGYHRLVVTAVTIGTNEEVRELELFNDLLIYVASDSKDKDFHKLYNPTFVLEQSAGMDVNDNVYNYSISSKITITDKDKVIKDGKFFIELQDSAYNNACPNNEDSCRATVDVWNGKCTFGDGRVSECSIVSQSNDSSYVNIAFDGLKADTNYSVYVYANTYRNNVDLKANERDGLVYVRKNQYTKSPLNFSLGAVTPTAVSKNNLVITFAGAANLTQSLVGIKYTITVQGGGQIASGILGSTSNSDTTKLIFEQDKDKYPTLSIPIPEGQELGLNNYIIITYYYKDKDGNVVMLDIGGNTSYQYTVKNES